MTPTELKNIAILINGGATIDDTLLQSLLNQGRTILFSERDWMFLRRTDTTVTVTKNSDSWNTAISISGITDFLRFFNTDLGQNSYSIVLFDSGADRKDYFRQVPFSKRLEYKNVLNTFVYDRVNKSIYFNGQIPFTGTLYINIVMNPVQIDIALSTNMETVGSMPLPAVYHPILAYYAVGINKGAIDYDDINRQMLPSNQAVLNSLKNALEKWDTSLQLDEQMGTDPTGSDMGYFRSGAINVNL